MVIEQESARDSMKISPLPFFKKIHLLVTSPAYLLSASLNDKVLKTILYIVMLLVLSSAVTALIRTNRVINEFPQSFAQAFGEVSVNNNIVTFSDTHYGAISKRDLSRISSTLFALDIPPAEMVEVLITQTPVDSLDHRAIQLYPTGYGMTTSSSGLFSSDSNFSTEQFIWPDLSSFKGTMVLSSSTIYTYLTTYKVSLFIALWVVFMVITLSLLTSYILLLFILTFFYTRKDPLLKSALVRLKLVLYLMTPYFILTPLFAIVLDGLGQVSGVALVLSSIILIRLSFFRRAQISPVKESK